MTRLSDPHRPNGVGADLGHRASPTAGSPAAAWPGAPRPALVALASMSRTVSRICFGHLVRRLQLPDRARVVANRLGRGERPARVGDDAARREPDRDQQAAATSTTADATSIQRRQAAQRSASVIAVLPGRRSRRGSRGGTRGGRRPRSDPARRAAVPASSTPMCCHFAVEELDRPVRRASAPGRAPIRSAPRCVTSQRCSRLASRLESRRSRRTTPPTLLAANVETIAPGGVL